jgi:hypothetical protein
VIDKEKGRPAPGTAPHQSALADQSTESAALVSSAAISRGSNPPVREWHRRQFAHDLRVRRRNSRELDRLCGIEEPGISNNGAVYVAVAEVRRLAMAGGGSGGSPWPRELSNGELDAYGHGFNDGFDHGFSCGRAA